MIWAILALIGIPLWLCAIGIFVLISRNSSLRHRPGNVPVRMRPEGKRRWTRGHAVWVHDVLAFRGSPAAWAERLIWVETASVREPTPDETKRLRRLGDGKLIVSMTTEAMGTLSFAARPEHGEALLGPFAEAMPIREGVSA